MKTELELYIHIPFCARKCAYCDFLSYVAPERAHRAYMEKLIEEIHGQGADFQDYRVVSIFVGGGTPSILPAELIEQMFAALYECFDIAEDAEITIEANPGTLTMEKLETYIQSGINRLSLGLQSADDEELKTLGRIHCYDDFLKSYQRARQAGFTNINIDLMSSLPNQTMQSWKNTLRKVMMLKPEHISAYSLMIEEGTPFYDRYREDVSAFPDEETDREMYHMTKKLLDAQGYERYEISNYAKAGYECRHNIGYWTDMEYLGLGLGASSYTRGFRYHNTFDMEDYLSLDLNKAGAAARDIQKLTLEDRMEEYMFLGLRRMNGVSGSEFMERFGQNMWNVYGDELKRLEKLGVIEIDPPRVRLTERGIDVNNLVSIEFLIDPQEIEPQEG